MRFLKSLVLLLFWTAVQAQDTTSVVIEAEPDSLFRADKKTGVTWYGLKVPDSTVQRLRRDDAFWYANADVKKPKTQNNNPSFWQALFRQTWLFNLLWTLIIGSFIAVLFLFLMKSNISLFRKGATRIGKDGAPQKGENIFSIDYGNGLAQALATQDFQSAVRLHYLHTLTLLSDKKWIDYKEERTNSDYVQQLRQTPYYGDFKKLTRHFEQAWYGRFRITPQAYQTIEQDFTTFKWGMGV